jgi:hypothetical protein
MEAIVNWIVGFDENNDIVKTLQISSIKSRKVLGRGTLIVDTSEVRHSESFKNDAKKAVDKRFSSRVCL